MSNKGNSNSIKKIKAMSLAQIGLMAALTYIAAYAIIIPVGQSAVFHLGDGVLFLSVILLGTKKGAIAATIGMVLFDLLSGFYLWAPFTLLIKIAMAYTAGTIAYRKGYKGENLSNNLLAFIASGVVMILGYFIAGGILNHFVYGIPTLGQGFIIAIADIPANIIQVIGGIAIGLPLSLLLKKHLGRYIK